MTMHSDGQTTIVWLRRDLRLAANPALVAAAGLARGRGAGLLPVFVWEASGRRPLAPGAASRWWLWHSLTALEGDLRRAGSRLAVTAGVGKLILTHHDRRRRDSQIDRLVRQARRIFPATRAARSGMRV